jgi:hypothetical protein
MELATKIDFKERGAYVPVADGTWAGPRSENATPSRDGVRILAQIEEKVK